MTDLVYQISSGDTPESVAARYTIGGAAYGPAVASLAESNGWIPGNYIVIPSGWLTVQAGGSYTGIGNNSTGISLSWPLILIIGGLLLTVYATTK